MLLEWGANAPTVRHAVHSAARGLGCDTVETFSQHAAVMVMLRRGEESCMQMGKVGEHGVNLRRAEAVLRVVDDVSAKRLDCEGALEQLGAVVARTGVYPVWFVCLSTGLACAAFGKLLGADTLAILPILAGAGTGQYLRHAMLGRKMNLFLMVTVVSFVSSLIAGLGGRLLGDTKLDTTAVASILLLVPGVAILNAQVDAIDGRPNLAAARVLRIIYILLFMTLGFILSQQIVHF
jgi:uncharacterized membrane protein YjjP (DUF1212 family)